MKSLQAAKETGQWSNDIVKDEDYGQLEVFSLLAHKNL